MADSLSKKTLANRPEKTIYDKMWQSFKLASQNNQIELDPYLLHEKRDTRRGITALAYLQQINPSLLTEISRFQNEIQALEPKQYYQPLEDLHLTIFTLLSCRENFRLEDLDITTLCEAFYAALAQSSAIKIQFQGVSASSQCIILQGFPMDDALDELRQALRFQFSRAKLTVPVSQRYWPGTAHTSLIRFRVPVNDPQHIYALCKKYRDHHFGTIVLNDIQLVFNNWYHSVSKRLAGIVLPT
ncbi:hypothetical protein [Gayadomonas joobiniege]|uniref:hypothetical protein n=1 Tax=Gayadomonas joobiniege TaxID=1234606 RepID=UPI0012DC5020|nr:hypothetical protein [Gayadomonas joobiniege]